MTVYPRFLSLLLILILPLWMAAQKATDKDSSQDPTLEKVGMSGLTFRTIGPAVTSGRVIDIEVNPSDPSEWYVASGHGSLWKTTNAGVTFSPIFDGQATYPMGAVALDPSNPHVVWVGTGENNAHSYVIPGDGVFKSEDGGKSWVNKGLKESQQIGDILVHPTHSNIVWVAAYGPHRQPGGDRGVFMTRDGGETWKNVLHPSEYTGCWELHIDPRNPDVLYTVAHQRQRYLTTIVTGGDESGIYKSTDGGETWNRLKGGLPQTMVGRIGMDVSPVDPDVLFAVVDAKENKGTYKSTDAGASWTKVSDYVTSYAFYCQKLVCDPVDINRVYGMDVFNQVSIDGGVTWSRFGEDKKHVDNHALWIEPTDARHMISGCDGGVYESFDRGKTWHFKANLPLAECYKVTVDNAKPFYNVYIGTQDNNSLGGPSRTINSGGISNADWYFTLGGDGFETQVDWADPNIVYSQSQFGNLTRYDKRTGERLYLRSFEGKGEEAYRFDWDAALLISRHDHKRLYHGGNKVMRSDDRGESWREVSPDLTRGVPKELHRLMGRSWSIDEMVAKSSFAHIVTIAESPLDEDILYAGSGDGLLHYSHDGGQNWERGQLYGLPEYARIHHIIASAHDTAVAYAACHDFFAGNFKPYLYKTTNGGQSWNLINANLPEKGVTYTIGEDHVNPDLLFVGTMYGVFVSNTPSPHWVQLKAGLPASMCVMDLDIQRDETDLVVSSFGRGVYILDDYSPLRDLTPETLKEDAVLFPVDEGLMFIEADPLGFPGVGFQGASYYTAPNPEVGAVIRYYIKDEFKSLKDQRNESEKKTQEAGKDVRHPSYETLKKEAAEEEPYVLFAITDLEGRTVRTLKQAMATGVQEVIWDFRTSPVGPVSLKPYDNSVPWNSPELGYMVVPGQYLVSMYRVDAGQMTALSEPQVLTCRPLHQVSITPSEQVILDRFNKEVARLSRAMSAADAHRSHLESNLPYLDQAVRNAPVLQPQWLADLSAIKMRLKTIQEKLNGDPLLPKYEGQGRMSLKGKVDLIVYALWSTTSNTTGTFQRAYQEAREDFDQVLAEMREVDTWIQSLEQMLEQAGAPYTPGRFPEWDKK